MYGFFSRPAFDAVGNVTGREVDAEGDVVVVRLLANADDRDHHEAKGFEFLGWAPAPGTSTPLALEDARKEVAKEAKKRGVKSRGWSTLMTPREARAMEIERADPEMAEKGMRERAAEIARARGTEERWADPARSNVGRAVPAGARGLQTADRPEERPGSEPGGPAERALADAGDREAIRAVSMDNPGGLAHERMAERAADEMVGKAGDPPAGAAVKATADPAHRGAAEAAAQTAARREAEHEPAKAPESRSHKPRGTA